jgi:hypothetical protein
MALWKRKNRKVTFGIEKQRAVKLLLQRGFIKKPIQKPGMQKPTEIMVGFERHMPGFVEKKKTYFDKADVILLELPPWIVKRLRGGEDPMVLAHAYTYFPEYSTELFKLLQQKMKEGKTVMGTDIQTRESVRKTQEGDKLQIKGNIEGATKTIAEMDKIREQKRLEWLLEHLPQFEGKKIYIDAGSLHTSIYHGLKEVFREKENKGEVKITREYLAKGMFEAPQILEKYSPFDQIERFYRFKKGKFTEADRKRIAELVEQDKLFFYKAMLLRGKYMGQGMTEERAVEKAHFELLRRLQKEGLKK